MMLVLTGYLLGAVMWYIIGKYVMEVYYNDKTN